MGGAEYLACRAVAIAAIAAFAVIAARQAYWLILYYFGDKSERTQERYLKKSNFFYLAALIPPFLGVILMSIIGC